MTEAICVPSTVRERVRPLTQRTAHQPRHWKEVLVYVAYGKASVVALRRAARPLVANTSSNFPASAEEEQSESCTPTMS